MTQPRGQYVMSKHYLHLGKLKHLRQLLEAETAVVAAVGEEVCLQATFLQGRGADTVSVDRYIASAETSVMTL